MELLKSIPRGNITDVQLADGPLAAENDLWEEASHRRELPGTGELPTKDILTLLRQNQDLRTVGPRSEEHTSELQSLMRISYAVFCLKKKKILCDAHTPQH